MNNHELKKGYKQTDVGIIPEDWEVKELGEILNVIGGYGFNSTDSQEMGVRWLKIANVGVNQILWDDESYLPKNFINSYQDFALKKDDLVIALTRPILGKKLKIAKLQFNDAPCLLNQRVGKIESKENTLKSFLYYLLQQEHITTALLQSMAGTDPPNLSNKGIYSIKSVCPQLHEQKAIAEVLSDVDALITSLDELIAKKRNIKQGTMSLLLTGKKRLVTEVKNGFKQTEVGIIPQDWEIDELGNLTTLLTNGFVGVATFHYTNSDNGILYIQGFNVEENSFNLTGIKRVTLDFHKRNSKSNLRKGDLLTIQTGDVGLTTIVPKSLEGSNCHALIISRFKNWKAFSKYYSHYFNSHIGRNRLKDLETATTMKHLNVGEMKYWKIPVPTLAEQKAIAEILSEMDAEIEALEAKRDKYKAVKQGMMQELLTGKTRLKIVE